jgi:uncharacterized membrane protein YbhN (UPF0104 family)
MAAGALLGVLLLPRLGLLPVEVSGRTSAFLAMAALPVALGVLNALAARVVARRRGPHSRPLPAPSVWLLAQGLVHGACGYLLLGLSLGLTITAVVPGGAPIPQTYPADLGATAISYVAGFVVVVAPGGLGARELVLAAALTPRFAAGLGQDAAALAIVVALMLRFVWTIAELVIAVPLYFFPPPAAPIPHHTHHPELLDPPAVDARPHA